MKLNGNGKWEQVPLKVHADWKAARTHHHKELGKIEEEYLVCVCVYNLLPKAIYINGFPGGSARKVFTRTLLPMLEMQETSVLSLGQEDPPEKEMATHPSIFAWKIPWIEEPGGLQSMGLQRVGWT